MNLGNRVHKTLEKEEEPWLDFLCTTDGVYILLYKMQTCVQ